MKKINSSVELFISHCTYEKNLSPQTIKAYSIDLKQFLKFLWKECGNKRIEEVDKEIIKNYLKHISNAKPKTIKRKIATLKSYFKFLEFEDLIQITPFRKMEVKIKEPKNIPNVMNIKEVYDVINYAYKCKGSKSVSTFGYSVILRNIAIVELLFATGIRVSELCNLKPNDIDFLDGTVRVRGKGSKERMIQICNIEIMNALISYYNKCFDKIEKSGYFFINRLNRKMSDQSVRLIVKKYSSASGIKRAITPHTFRHSFATLLLEQDVDIKYIQQLLGHSSILTTQIYTHVNREKQRSILSQKHPRENFTVYQ